MEVAYDFPIDQVRHHGRSFKKYCYREYENGAVMGSVWYKALLHSDTNQYLHSFEANTSDSDDTGSSSMDEESEDEESE